MCKDLFPRINRIRSLVPLTMSYNMVTGSNIFFSGLAGEWQVSCHVHGYDRRPSARIYSESGKIYCFVCAEAWDSADYFMAYHGYSWKDRNSLVNMVSVFENNYDIASVDLEQFKVRNVVSATFSGARKTVEAAMDYHKLFESLWYTVNDFIISSLIADKDKYFKFLDIMWDKAFTSKAYKQYWQTLTDARSKLLTLNKF